MCVASYPVFSSPFHFSDAGEVSVTCGSVNDTAYCHDSCSSVFTSLCTSIPVTMSTTIHAICNGTGRTGQESQQEYTVQCRC